MLIFAGSMGRAGIEGAPRRSDTGAAGAYVSEVSSLPAYPALVYVKDGPKRRFVATDYQGKRHEYADNLALADAIEAAFWSAVRVTFVGSSTPSSRRSP